MQRSLNYKPKIKRDTMKNNTFAPETVNGQFVPCNQVIETNSTNHSNHPTARPKVQASSIPNSLVTYSK